MTDLLDRVKAVKPKASEQESLLARVKSVGTPREAPSLNLGTTWGQMAFAQQVPDMLASTMARQASGTLTAVASAQAETGRRAGNVLSREVIAQGSTRQGYAALRDNLDPSRYHELREDLHSTYEASIPSQELQLARTAAGAVETGLRSRITVGEKPYSAAWFARKGIEQSIPLAQTIGAFAVGGPPGAAAMGLMLEAGDSAQSAYETARTQGLSEEKALNAGYAAMREYAPSAGVLEAIMPSAVSGVGGLARRAATGVLTEGTTEAAQTALQESAVASATGTRIQPGLGGRMAQSFAIGGMLGGAGSVFVPGRPMLSDPAKVTDYVRANPQGAQVIAAKAKPTQADFKAAGIQGEFRARQRERIADQVRLEIASPQEVSEAPAEAQSASHTDDRQTPPSLPPTPADQTSAVDPQTPAELPYTSAEAVPSPDPITSPQQPHLGLTATWRNPAATADAQQKFAGLPDDAVVTVFHGTTAAGAANLSSGAPVVGSLHIAPTPADAAQYGDVVIAMQVRKGDIGRSPDSSDPNADPITGLFNSSLGATIPEGSTPSVVQRIDASGDTIAFDKPAATYLTTSPPATPSPSIQPSEVAVPTDKVEQPGGVSGVGKVPIVDEMIAAGQESVAQLRSRIADVKYGKDNTITFTLDGKPHVGVMKGRNADLVLGTPEQNAGIAARVFLDGDAKGPVESKGASTLKPLTEPLARGLSQQGIKKYAKAHGIQYKTLDEARTKLIEKAKSLPPSEVKGALSNDPIESDPGVTARIIKSNSGRVDIVELRGPEFDSSDEAFAWAKSRGLSGGTVSGDGDIGGKKTYRYQWNRDTKPSEGKGTPAAPAEQQTPAQELESWLGQTAASNSGYFDRRAGNKFVFDAEYAEKHGLNPKVLYRGMSEPFKTIRASKEGAAGPGVYLAENRKKSEVWAGAKGVVQEYYARALKPLMIDIDDRPNAVALNKYAREHGYDSLYIPSEGEWVIFDPANVRFKEQPSEGKGKEAWENKSFSAFSKDYGGNVLFTPSVNQSGKWQVTRFDKSGKPSGDTIYPSWREAVDTESRYGLDMTTAHDPRAKSQTTTTLPDGRVFPVYNGEVLSWNISMTDADAAAGYPKTKAVIAAMREHKPQQLEAERREMVKASMTGIHRGPAKKVLELIEQSAPDLKPPSVEKATPTLGSVVPSESASPQLLDRPFQPDDLLEMRSPHSGNTTMVSFRGPSPVGNESVVWTGKTQMSVPNSWLSRSRASQLEVLRREFDEANETLDRQLIDVEKGKPLPPDYVKADKRASELLAKITELEAPQKAAEAKAKSDKQDASRKAASTARDNRIADAPVFQRRNGWEIVKDGAEYVLRHPVGRDDRYSGKLSRVRAVADEAAPDTIDSVESKGDRLEAMGAMAGGEDVVGPGGIPMPEQAAKAQRLASEVRESMFGRPELANPGISPEARQVMDAIDESRKQAGVPDRESMAAWRAEATSRLALDRAGELDKMNSMYVEGRLPDKIDQIAQQQLTDEALQRAANAPVDSAESAMAWVEAHRRASIQRSIGGTEVARSLVARRDLVLTRKQRLEQALFGVLSSGSEQTDTAVAKAHEQVVIAQAKAEVEPSQENVIAVETARKAAAKVLDDTATTDAKRTLTAVNAMREIGVDVPAMLDRVKELPENPTPATQRAFTELGNDIIQTIIAIRRLKALSSGENDKLGAGSIAEEYFLSSVLSGLRTQVVNITGNIGMLAHQAGLTRGIEGAINVIARRQGAAQLGEYGVIAKHSRNAVNIAFQNMLESIKYETPILEEQVNVAREIAGKDPIPVTAKVELEDLHKSISSRNPRLAWATSRFGAGAVDKTGKAIRSPLIGLGAMDELVKSYSTLIEVQALAYRDGVQRRLSGDALDTYIEAETLDKSSGTWERAINTAKERAAQRQLPKSVRNFTMAARNLGADTLGFRPLFYVMPFVTTPFNLLRLGVTKFTPAVSIGPAVKAIQAMRGKQAYSGGEIVHDMAENLIGWGLTFAIAALMDAVPDDEQGRPFITGSTPTDPAERERWKRLGIEPSAMLVNGRYYSFASIEPFATGMTMVVDTINGFKQGGTKGGALAALQSPLRQLQDKTFLRGISDFMEMGRGVAMGDYGALQYWSTSFASSWVPNLFRATARASDDLLRDTSGQSFGQQLRTKALPVGSLPIPQVDIWGRDIRKSGSPWFGPTTDFAFRLLSPVSIRELPDAVKADMLLTNWNNRAGPDERIVIMRPDRSFRLNGKRETMSDDEYLTFERRAGELALQYLEKHLTDQHVQNPTLQVARAVKNVVGNARDQAKAEIIRDRRK